jgi:hypothetical protein
MFDGTSRHFEAAVGGRASSFDVHMPQPLEKHPPSFRARLGAIPSKTLTPPPPSMAVRNYKHIEQLMEEGTKARTVASTNMNATSSRCLKIDSILHFILHSFMPRSLVVKTFASKNRFYLRFFLHSFIPRSLVVKTFASKNRFYLRFFLHSFMPRSLVV